MVRSLTEVIKTKNMENPKQQLIERLKTANNVLVTVSSDPSVDQLAAAIGLTLMLNKMGKHGTAVFSGKVPSTIQFLQPEKTIEKNTDSLRDFIIALDKTKADKLRYKVEDNHVRIFITPYRTSINETDLEFSQGDFNVEVVVALGVSDQKDLDKAITAHGRILHDATTISITNGASSTLGSINWDQEDISSLCEMIASIAPDLQANLLDGQMATALMTGIVAQTERFLNAKTSPQTMSVSSSLMAAGANQQLIASELETPSAPQAEQTIPIDIPDITDSTEDEASNTPDNSDDDIGALLIDHENEPPEQTTQDEPEELDMSQFNLPDDSPQEEAADQTSSVEGRGALMMVPPMMGGTLTANSRPESLDPSTDPMTAKDDDQTPLLDHQGSKDEPDTTELPAVQDIPAQPTDEKPMDLPLPPAYTPPTDSDQPQNEPAPVTEPVTQAESFHEPTLTELEETVNQPSTPELPPEQKSPDVFDARDAVSDALASIGGSQQSVAPIQSLNAQPFDINDQIGTPPAMPLPPQPGFTMPENLVPPAGPSFDPTAPSVSDPTAPPAVPPPFMPNMPGFDPGPAQPAQQQAPQNNPFNLPPA